MADDKWIVKELTTDHIEAVAAQHKISLKGVDTEDVAHSVRKGVEAALYNCDDIVLEAIRNNLPDEDLDD
jgi:hypothetical protein